MPNRLANETSPYLRQHADNPVDWYPWGDEAFERARREDKPILLSIGYAACHWCHVMERESFEDAETARIMNENFVNIKVDREERPDIDQVYMTAVQAMTGHGGWPLTVFLTPDGVPFYGGTYFPKEARHGLPAFKDLLRAVAEAWRNRRQEILAGTARVREFLEQQSRAVAPRDQLDAELLRRAARALLQGYDPVNGGFGTAPKFPQPLNLEFLLRAYRRFKIPEALIAVEHTLKAMARGGIYDQVGGGFHRYSTDDRWLVPHFEKMLYDQALLLRVYLGAYQLTGDPLFRQVIEETLGFAFRELYHPDGAFYSSLDADSEGEEGKYYVWTAAEVDDLLAPEEAEAVKHYYGLIYGPNFEGKNILHVRTTPEKVAGQLGRSPEELAETLARAKAKLLAARERRVPPARDDKVLTSWNGLMLRALAEVGAALDRPEWIRAAERLAHFIETRLGRPDGSLWHSFKEGVARVEGLLEDYAFYADGLLSLYEVTGELRWFRRTVELAGRLINLFWDPSLPGFFDATAAHDNLPVRPRSFIDNALPSGSSVATELLLRLGALTGEGHYREVAEANLRALADFMLRAPAGAGRLLSALDFSLGPVKEVALVGPAEDPTWAEMYREVFGRYLPNKVVALGPGAAEEVPLLAGREAIAGRPTAYVCQNFVCQLPARTVEELRAQLEGD
ncbi:MAG: thioredoxin domain-containing protein [Chloroflexota bacterium]